MKKLNQIQIKPERLMDNKELLKLRGGYDPCTCLCVVNKTGQILGYLLCESGWCVECCENAFYPGVGGDCVS